VHFYDSEDLLAESVRDHLLPALRSGGAVVVVATVEHRDAIEAMLVGAGINLSELAMSSRYITRDAEGLLGVLMADETLDTDAFHRTVGDLLSKASNRGRSVSIFGEMVALLWNDGNIEVALQIEELWNELATKHRFSLFCAYAMSSFGAADKVPFEAVCGCHTKVLLPGGNPY
jgi:hypothetical protein